MKKNTQNSEKIAKKTNFIPLFYWGDIYWLSFWFQNLPNVEASLSQTYRKQRNFNRCSILTGNGIETLTVPVSYEGLFPKISEIFINYKENWQKKHLRALYFAYKNSAYFEHYYPDIEAIISQKFEKIHEINLQILNLYCKWLKIQPIAVNSSEKSSFPFAYRLEETPKNLKFPNYFQLFSEHFIPNLCPIDAFMNLGHEVSTSFVKLTN